MAVVRAVHADTKGTKHESMVVDVATDTLESCSPAPKYALAVVALGHKLSHGRFSVAKGGLGDGDLRCVRGGFGCELVELSFYDGKAAGLLSQSFVHGVGEAHALIVEPLVQLRTSEAVDEEAETT